MWEKSLDHMLRRLIVQGRLRVRWPDEAEREYGSGGGLDACVTLTDRAIIRQLCLRPVMALGEGYMNGQIEVPDEGLFDLVALLVRNRQAGALPFWVNLVQRARGAAMGWLQRNDPRRARRNVAHHYDISDDFYALFLDRDWQYSCAYFTRPDMSLEEAQAAKKAHIAAKLRIEPDMRVLDIGCGWGGMALTLARDHGARVTGVTLSRNQLARAQARVRDAGLSDRIDLRLMDYRALDEQFDRIVSVGMLEHVGLPQFQTYFDRVQQLLDPNGIALIHTIGHLAPPSPTSPWIARYIFPGGYVPSLSDLAPVLERSHLWLSDLEVLRGHYALTLRHWRARFEAQVDKVRAMYDERFVRMWRFYLIASEAAFENQHQAVFQMQLAPRQHTVPATRDYLYYREPAAQSHAAQ